MVEPEPRDDSAETDGPSNEPRSMLRVHVSGWWLMPLGLLACAIPVLLHRSIHFKSWDAKDGDLAWISAGFIALVIGFIVGLRWLWGQGLRSGPERSCKGILTPIDASPIVTAILDSHDIPCPGCGYNLRGLMGDRCPECHHPIRVWITTGDPTLRWRTILGAASITLLATTALAILQYGRVLSSIWSNPGFTIRTWLIVPWILNGVGQVCVLVLLGCGLALWFRASRRGATIDARMVMLRAILWCIILQSAIGLVSSAIQLYGML